MTIIREQHANTLVKIEIEKQLHAEDMKKRDEEFRAYMKKQDEKKDGKYIKSFWWFG